MIRRGLVVCASVLLVLAALGLGPSPLRAQSVEAAASPAPSSSPSPRPQAQETPASVASPAASLPGFPFTLPAGGAPTTQTYAAFMKGAERFPGVIDLVRKDDELYFDLSPAVLGRTFILAPSIASGVGSGAFAGRVYDPILVRFKRVGKRILWISPNTKYVAQKGSAVASSLAISTADTVLLSTPIIAEDAAKEHLIVAPSIFLTDFEGIGADLGRAVSGPSLPGLIVLGGRPAFGLDASKSYYASTKAFPRNDEISVVLTFTGPAEALPTVPDGRGIPLIVHYSIVAPPAADPNFVPRYADDRVGYFITARKRYDDDTLASPFERFINRWNLDNGPITFYLTSEIPPQYRDTVRRGILAWNDAFARIGRPNAIVVKDQPNDPTWDPDDARYTTVRWITSDRPDFAAYSPSVVDPDSGEIIRAEVVIDGESLRSIKRGFIDSVLPLNIEHGTRPAAQAAGVGEDEADLVAQAALGTMALAQEPHTTAGDRERYAQAWLYSTVLHEVGHTFGLRHNFEGSTAYSQRQLHDPSFTRTHGTTASVMDYTPVNLAGPGQRQADYFPTRLGVYDYWAIAYGYTRFPTKTTAGEVPYLKHIAARSTEPGLAYGTDEDAFDPLAPDPRISRFDLSSDPLGHDAEALALDEHLADRLTHTYPGDARSYEDIRQSMITILGSELSSTLLASHYVGGIYTSRAHRGQRGGEPPFRSIPRAEQRRAFDLIDRYMLSSKAFRYPPALLNELGTSRFGFHWDSPGIIRTDFPISEVIARLQDATIESMFSAPSLARIYDQSLKVAHPGDTMSLTDLFTWMRSAVYDDLGARSIAPTHRELQRRYADLMSAYALAPTFIFDVLGVPREAQSLARATLVEVNRRIGPALLAAKDPATRAHLDDLRSRIRGALGPQTIRSI
jgi:hypothetical protein